MKEQNDYLRIKCHESLSRAIVAAVTAAILVASHHIVLSYILIFQIKKKLAT